MVLSILIEAALYTTIDIGAIALVGWAIATMAEEVFPVEYERKYPIRPYTLLKGTNRFWLQDLRTVALVLILLVLLLWLIPIDQDYQLIGKALLVVALGMIATLLVIASSIRYLSIREEQREAELAQKRSSLPESFRF